MYNSEKIGVGLITFNRPKHFERVFQSLKDAGRDVDEVIIVKDGGGATYDRRYQDGTPMIEFIDNGCNCRSKTTAWSYLITQGCKHIFLMEDDMIIKNPDVFKQYIETAKLSGIHHLMYCGVGGDNPKKLTLQYDDKIGIDLYQNYQGPFMYATADLIKEIGGWDMGFKNAFTHVDWSYRCATAGRIPPMWWAPDIKDSTDYVECIPECIQGSSNSEDMEKYKKNYQHSYEHWMKKYGMFTNQIPHTSQEVVQTMVRQMKRKYGEAL